MYISKFLHRNTEDHQFDTHSQSIHGTQPRKQNECVMPNTKSDILHRAESKSLQESKSDVQKDLNSINQLNSSKFTEEASEWDSNDFSQAKMCSDEIMNRVIAPSKSDSSCDGKSLFSLIDTETAHKMAKNNSRNDIQNLQLHQEIAALLRFFDQQQVEMNIEITELMNEKRSLENKIERLETLDYLYDENYIDKQFDMENYLQQLTTEEKNLEYELDSLQQEYEKIFTEMKQTQSNEEQLGSSIQELHSEIGKIEHDTINRKNTLDVDSKKKHKEIRLNSAKYEEFAVQHEILRQTVEQLKENNQHLKQKINKLQPKSEARTNGLDFISTENNSANIQLQTANNAHKSPSNVIGDLERDFSMISNSYLIKPSEKCYENEILDVGSISRCSNFKDGQDDSFLNTVVITPMQEDTLNLTDDLNELADQIKILEELVEIRNEILKEYDNLPQEDRIHRTALKSELAKANYQIGEISSFIHNKAIVFP